MTTLAEAQKRLNESLDPGVITRDLLEKIQFQLFDISDKRFKVAHMISDYKYQGPYGPHQQVDNKGFRLTVWVDNQRSSRRLVKPGDDLESLIPEMVKEASELCLHRNTTWTGKAGNCLNNYRCNDCGEEFSIDSSG